MRALEFVDALALPAGARVDRRVPKKLLLEQAGFTAADRRLVNEGVDELTWLAALKPTTIGVAAVRDDVREYLEIAVIHVVLRESARTERLITLLHRVVPYPVVLVASSGEACSVSFAHKRWSQGEVGATVIDGELLTAVLLENSSPAIESEFGMAMGITRQPHSDLFALYQGWIETVEALLAARITGAFGPALDKERAAIRRLALVDCARLESRMVRLRSAAAAEPQVAKQIELNLELQRAKADLAAARARL